MNTRYRLTSRGTCGGMFYSNWQGWGGTN